MKIFFINFIFLFFLSLTASADLISDADIQSVLVQSDTLYFDVDDITYQCTDSKMQDLILFQYRSNEPVTFDYTDVLGENIVNYVESVNYQFVAKVSGLFIGALSASVFVLGYFSRIK